MRKYKSKRYRSRRPRRYRRMKRGRRSLRKTIRRTVNQMAETKKFSIIQENVQLYHNTPLTAVLDPWSNVGKGTNGNNRVGDKLTSRGVSFVFTLHNKMDRPNVWYRILIGTSPQSYNGVVIDTSNLPGFIWRSHDVALGGAFPSPPGGGQSKLLSHVDKERGFRTIFDKSYKCTDVSGDVDRENFMKKKIWIKPKRSGVVQFSDTGLVTRGRWLFAVVLCFDSWGTLLSDNIASYAITIDLYWKDL